MYTRLHLLDARVKSVLQSHCLSLDMDENVSLNHVCVHIQHNSVFVRIKSDFGMHNSVLVCINSALTFAMYVSQSLHMAGIKSDLMDVKRTGGMRQTSICAHTYTNTHVRTHTKKCRICLNSESKRAEAGRAYMHTCMMHS